MNKGVDVVFDVVRVNKRRTRENEARKSRVVVIRKRDKKG